MENNKLTICSVYHSPETRELLEFNFDLAKKYNPDGVFRWIAIDNTMSGGGAENGRDGLDVIPGRPRNASLPRWAQGSYHHAGAINDSLKYVKTRFALILDNDFYIIRQNWVNDVAKHMAENNLAFFGAPYHPSRFTKYRYFPCAQCLFIDCSKVKVSDLDFLPKYPDILRPRYFSRRLKKMVRNFFQLFIGKRITVGTARDTGYKIFESYGMKNDIKYESVKPVFRLFVSFFDKFLPERFCLTPKKADSYSRQGFKDLNYADAGDFGWEEYIWKNAPFAVHLQMSRGKDKRTVRSEVAEFKEFLSRLN